MMKLLDVPARWLSAVVLILSLVSAQAAFASVSLWVGPDLGNWNTPANWNPNTGDPPNAGFGEAGAINNNTTAVLSAAATFPTGGVLLGQAAADIGGLRIASGGTLNAIAAAPETGALQIGIAGRGNLTVLGGGTITGTNLSLGGIAASSITLGDTTASAATLTASGSASLNRTTTVIGPNVNFSATGNLTLGSTSILEGQIRNATLHSPLKSSGTATINGVFRPSFVGVTPAVGNKWSIIDATAINGNMTLDVSQAPALAGASAYSLIREDGGTNGKLLRLTVEQLLTLNVNRTTGAVSISNTGTSAHTIDGYSILSPLGALTGSWTSLQDSGVAGWVEAAPVATDLSELNPQSSSTINGGASLPGMGNPYQAKFPAFGIDPDDVKFEYTLTNGRVVQGFVNYTGAKVNNDLIVTVNKTTGQAQIKNDSPFSVSIDGYAIYSPSGALVPGSWNSLADQSVTGWQEAQPTSTVVSELRASGALTLTPGSGYNIGGLYTPGGSVEDLRLEFLLPGQEDPQIGTLIYGALGPISPPPAGVLGDYNNNNVVDAADYVVWRNSVGQNIALPNDGGIAGPVGPNHYNQWRANFGKVLGSGSGSSLAAIPEPVSALLLVSALVACVASRGTRRSRR